MGKSTTKKPPKGAGYLAFRDSDGDLVRCSITSAVKKALSSKGWIMNLNGKSFPVNSRSSSIEQWLNENCEVYMGSGVPRFYVKGEW